MAMGSMAGWPPLVPSSAAVSARMSSFPRRNTAPELALRRLLHARGLRYRVNLPVPGLSRRTIDVAFPRAKIAIFVDGCYWHGCPDHGRVPNSNREWWTEKLRRNQARDVATTEHLRATGWEVVRFWEHQPPEQVADLVEQAVRRTFRSSAAGRPQGGPVHRLDAGV
jgi:DNA mismatch endonuclease (patch repair protein)